MSERPLVSIVLPTHNGSRYLRCAVENVIAQTYQRWELILVDDASTDETPQIIAAFAARDPRIRSTRNATNRGLPASLNDGFSLAKGDLLTWTSDDNCHRPEAIAEMVAFLEANPQIDVVYADYTLIGEDGAPIRSVAVQEPPMLAFDNVLGACFLYKRAVHERLRGYAEDLFLAEDYDFWLRAAADFRLARLGKDLYCYRMHDGSLTAQRAESIARAHQQALCRNLPAMRWLNRDVRALAYVELARRAFRRNDRRGAQYLLVRAICQSPRMLVRRYRSRSEWSGPFWRLFAYALGLRGRGQPD